MAGSFLQALAEAHDWCETLGGATSSGRHCRLVICPQHPVLWSANHASGVRASTPEEIDETLEDIEAAQARSPYRVVDADAFTPPAFLARLALDSWQEQPAAIVMALTGGMAEVRAPALEIQAVDSEKDWADLRRLYELDMSEAERPGGLRSPELAEGLYQATRKRAGAGRMFLARLDGRPCAYAMAIPAPGGFGFIDDVFTDPELRRRGIASAMVARCAEHLREKGSGALFLTALASDRPKHLYARLGFEPAMLVRRWVKTVA